MDAGRALEKGARAVVEVGKELHRTKEELFEGLGDSIYRMVLRGALGNEAAREFGGAGFQQQQPPPSRSHSGHSGDSLMQVAQQAYGMFQNIQAYQQYGQPSQQPVPGTTGPAYGPVP